MFETKRTLKPLQQDKKPMMNLDRSPYDTKKGRRKLLNIDESWNSEDTGDSEFLRWVMLGTKVKTPGSLPWERNNSLEQLQRVNIYIL